MDKTALGDRMKNYYEAVPKTFLMRRTPVILRLDGKSFHSFTRGFKKPFDNILIKTMQDTMKYLCENIQGCVLGYTQSDEITLVLVDYFKIDTDAWFGYNVQKVVSVSASMATLSFNNAFKRYVSELIPMDLSNSSKEDIKYYNALDKAILKGAFFDSRCFNIPKEEVNNCLLWRQQDATRNSIQALAQSLYPHKQIEGIDTKKLQDKMFTEKGINWNDLETTKKRGSCCIKIPTEIITPNGEKVIRNKWTIDNEIPIFSQDTEYVNSLVTPTGKAFGTY